MEIQYTKMGIGVLDFLKIPITYKQEVRALKNNEAQIKQNKGESLPVVSDNEQVQKNCMKLYIFLVSISKFMGRNKPREFSQRDFSVNHIREVTGLHDDTIKRYWKLLEDNKLVTYEGISFINSELYNNGTFEDWKKYFMARKKYKAGFYKLPKNQTYKIIPRETIDKIQNDFLVEESELKLYLLLANMQEHFCYLKPPERLFTIPDLRILLKISKSKANNKKIFESLCWLKELDLIDYEISYETNNLGTKNTIFELKQVNFYTNGGKAYQILSNEGEKMSAQIKQSILDEQLITFEEE